MSFYVISAIIDQVLFLKSQHLLKFESIIKHAFLGAVLPYWVVIYARMCCILYAVLMLVVCYLPV